MSANVEAAHQLTDALNARDVDAIKSVFTPDASFLSAKSGAQVEGADAVTNALLGWVDAHASYTLKTVREFFAGDEGYNEWHFTATSKDGQPVETHGVDYFRFAGGKIAVKNSFRKV
jgi:ketosteroid isomerase-like protein